MAHVTMGDPLALAALYFGLQILLGLPIGFVMISTVVVWSLVSGGDASLMSERVIFASVENIIVIAIPLFIFTAKVMDHGGISARLLKFCLALVGHRPGGLAQVNIASSIIFSGTSGDATSDTSGIDKDESDHQQEEMTEIEFDSERTFLIHPF